MKKTLILLFGLTFLFSKLCLAENFVFHNEDIYVWASNDRNPTATENDIANSIDPNWRPLWVNTVSGDVFLFKGGSNGSYVWDLIMSDKNLLSNLPTPIINKFYLGTAEKTNVKFISKSATVAGGAGVSLFYLTDDGLSTGNALCSNVYDESIAVDFNSNSIIYLPSWSLSGNKKTLTVTTNQSNFTTILGISALSTFGVAANGVVANLTLACD